MYRKLVWRTVLISCGFLACLGVIRGSQRLQSGITTSRATVSGTEQTEPVGSSSSTSSSSRIFPVTIRRPAGPPRVDLGIKDTSGKSITAACSTCHTSRAPDYSNRVPGDLTEFHQGLVFTHGKVTCLSCHNSQDYDTLKLADGTAVSYVDVMTLCAQCHGPQFNEYQHGAHGGMSGYWDLTRGPRTRNNCVDCHDPHAPAFPAMKPTFKPYDRFLSNSHLPKGRAHE